MSDDKDKIVVSTVGGEEITTYDIENDLEDEDVECEEADPTAITGVGGTLPSFGATRGGIKYPTFASGGVITTAVPGPGGTYWGTSPSTTTVPVPTTTKKSRMVNLPPKFTEKVLVAFIDEENEDDESNVVWAANLHPDLIEMVSEDGQLYLTIKLSMEDVYGNRKAD